MDETTITVQIKVYTNKCKKKIDVNHSLIALTIQIRPRTHPSRESATGQFFGLFQCVRHCWLKPVIVRFIRPIRHVNESQVGSSDLKSKAFQKPTFEYQSQQTS